MYLDRNIAYIYIKIKRLRKVIVFFSRPYLAVLVSVEIADIARFTDAAHLHAFTGVVPSTRSSGDRTDHGKIVGAGNRWLRWTAVEAVWQGIRGITIYAANSWPAKKARTKPKWPPPGDS